VTISITFSSFFSHRFAAAFFAISERCFPVSAFALAAPTAGAPFALSHCAVSALVY